MKITYKLALIFTMIFVVGISSCKKDDEDDDVSPGEAAYNAIEITDKLQGSMNGKDWMFSNGSCEKNTFSTPTSYRFNLLDTLLDGDSCNTNLSADNYEYILFSLEESMFKVGQYEMTNLGPNITLYIKTDGNGVNHPITEGTISISSIDTVGSFKFVTGSLDAYSKSDKYVKGTFTVKYCE